jgi:hypothetical protein
VAYARPVSQDETEELTPLRAAVLCAYFGLRSEGRPSQWIGATEIVRWLEQQFPDRQSPSPSLVVKVLQAQGLLHRARGNPAAQSRQPCGAPPFCAVRPSPPKSKSSR